MADKAPVTPDRPAPGGQTDHTAQNPVSALGAIAAGWKGLSDLSSTLKQAAGKR